MNNSEKQEYVGCTAEDLVQRYFGKKLKYGIQHNNYGVSGQDITRSQIFILSDERKNRDVRRCITIDWERSEDTYIGKYKIMMNKSDVHNIYLQQSRDWKINELLNEM